VGFPGGIPQRLHSQLVVDRDCRCSGEGKDRYHPAGSGAEGGAGKIARLPVSAIAGVPSDLAPLFSAAGYECPHISPGLLAAQAKIESVNFSADVISGKRRSPAGAMGVSQFMPGTWKTWGEGGNPYDPKDAIPAQARFMCELGKKYGGNVDLMLAAYNAGPGAVKNYGGVPQYRETRNYIKRIRAQWGQ